MNYKDRLIKEHIEQHYKDILNDMREINNDFNEFIKNKHINKSIKLDLLQIGENCNHFSDEIKSKIQRSDIRGIVDVRNEIVHGYSSLDDKTIWDTLLFDLPRLIVTINACFK